MDPFTSSARVTNGKNLKQWRIYDGGGE